jgi:uncharacterized membrane protein
MNFLLSAVVIVSIGLMIGVEFAVWVFINPILWKIEEPARTRVVRYFAGRLGKAMPFWYSVNLLLLLAEAFLLRGHAGARLIIAAIAIWVAVIILTLMFLVPINNRLARGTIPNIDKAHGEHKRWDAMHRARVVALVAAMVLFLLGSR